MSRIAIMVALAWAALFLPPRIKITTKIVRTAICLVASTQ